MENRIKFAVVGCGHIGKRHIEVIAQNPATVLSAICDVKKMNELGIQHIKVPYFNDIDLLLNSEIPMDVVTIATPNGWHEQHAIQALQAGKHVIIEKPMALSAIGCKRIIDEAAVQQKHIFCVVQNRYSPPTKWLKELIQNNTLGNIYMVQMNCFWNRDKRYYHGNTWHGTKQWDGGTLFTQFSHFIDMLYWLLGDITDIKAKFADFNHQHSTEFEDSGMVFFSLVQGGGMGSFQFSTSVWNSNAESSITIIAENGSVKIGGQYMNEVSFCNIRNYTLPQLPTTNAANDYGFYKGSAANHELVYKNVVDVLLHQAPITATGFEGMKVVEMIEKIYAAT